jgi:adenine deaminase
MYEHAAIQLAAKRPVERLLRVAQGAEPADLVIEGAGLGDVYTAELLAGHSVAIKQGWIAYVGPDAEHTKGPATEVVDAAGRVLLPGLIDAHTHIAWMFSPVEFLKHVIPGGTTTIITETLEPYPVAGIDGLSDFLAALREQPVKLFATAPPMVSISRAAHGISVETLRRLLARGDVLGLGETYWQSVLQDPASLVPLLQETARCGKLAEGHSAGARGPKLNAYLACGISSCHEPIDAEQVLERLRLGLHVMVREGSIRRDLKAIARIRANGVDLRRLVLVTDGISPAELLDKGYMEYVLQRAVDVGFDPLAAVQMATLNPAEHFGLDAVVGGIAPGRLADLLLVPDLRTIRPELVVSNGRIVARHGKLLVSPRDHNWAPASRDTIHLPRPLEAADMAVRPPRGSGSARVRVIELVTDLVTREAEAVLQPTDGLLLPQPGNDLIKVAAIDRTLTPGKLFTGFVRGFGLHAGALACSAAWDTTCIVVVGADEADMAAAVNRIAALKGGAVVCRDNKILAELPLPVFGLISTRPLRRLQLEMQAVQDALAGLGVRLADPLLTLITLTGAAIPYLRICEEGLINLKDGRPRSLFID